MSVLYESSGVVDSGGFTTTNLTIASVAVTGTNRNLSLWIGATSNSTTLSVSSITRGSDTFVEKASRNNRPSFKKVWGYLWNSTNEPQTTAADLTVTLSETTGKWGFSYISTTGVDQTARMGTPVLNADDFGSTCAESIAVSSTSGDLVLSGITARTQNTNFTTPCNSETIRESWNVSSLTNTGGFATSPGAPTVTLSWSIASGSGEIYVHYGANLSQAPTTSPTTDRLIMRGGFQDMVGGFNHG